MNRNSRAASPPFPAAAAGESLRKEAHDLSHNHEHLQSLFARQEPLAEEQ
jgi:hypothetical protein